MDWLSNLRSNFSIWAHRQRIARKVRRAQLSVPHRLGVMGIMKNEGMNVDEWIAHYLWMGAGKIYLIDNGSTDDTVAKVRAWQGRAPVELIEYPKPHQQVAHYRAAFRHFRIARQCQWLLIADLDEFWFCPNGDTIATALQEYRDIDVIYANWAMFGSGGHIDHPESLRTGLTLRQELLYTHTNTKYIARTRVLKKWRALKLHKVKRASSERVVSDNQRFQLNHYRVQSLEFFQKVKMLRGDACKTTSDAIRDMAYFHRDNEGCDVTDRKLADLVLAALNR